MVHSSLARLGVTLARSLLLPAVVVMAGSGCRVRSLHLAGGVDGGSLDAPSGGGETGMGGDGGGSGGGGAGGGGGGAGGARDGGDRVCLPAPEECNGLDDDCDGKTDEDFNLAMDTANCGRCGNICSFDHAFPSCAGGVCGIEACFPGFVDVDKKQDNGCECILSNGGSEICDDADNDCDGVVDNGFDKATDVDHCGGCGTVCSFAHASAMCAAGVCGMGTCEAGYLDLNKDATDGCEYKCVPSNGGVEICDSQDNDCDGKIDNSPTDAGGGCGPAEGNVGTCRLGVLTCTTGTLICVGAKLSSVELCDDEDNDCDGVTDNGFDKASDIRFCGGCTPCAVPHAVPKCVSSACLVDVCSPGYVDLDGAPGNGCEYPCVFRGPDICNGQDDDCNGLTDDGIDKNSDANNCGACGTVCRFPNAAASCAAGVCVMGVCDLNFSDEDGNASNGCEYFCVPSGAEKCDGIDNDCDGLTDEGFDRATDPANCGACGRQCVYSNATAVCAAGVCALGSCLPGFFDVDGKPSNGCEYACSKSNGGVEICDGIDNDCDTLVDESDARVGAGCYPAGVVGCVDDGAGDGGADGGAGDGGTDGGASFTCSGVCGLGTLACVGGGLVCQMPKTPGVEACNDLDDDCDGVTDNGFDKQNDIRWCGSCAPCAIPNAVPRCASGVCAILACSPGFFDKNGLPGDGCEYACTYRGAEICNGADDDCNGLTDEGIDKASDPRNCGSCGNVCAFANATALCTAGTCAMGACTTNFFDRNGSASDGCEAFCAPSAGGVEVCDGIDNDCDFLTDETFDKNNDPSNCGVCGKTCAFSNAGATCSGGVCTLGTCSADYYDLDGQAGNGCEYHCVKSGTPVGTEVCDGVDNDCDGQVDETYPESGGAANRCYPTSTPGCSTATGVCAGICRLGAYSCVSGSLVCSGAVGPQTEICDNTVDNDCDGITDDGFDKQNDIRWCGTCAPCVVPHAVPKCVAGACQVSACASGYVDLDGAPGNGCEYGCTYRGTEICNGLDDDCDGATDEGIDRNTDPNNCGTCGHVCSFANAVATCTGGGCVMGACLPNFYNRNGSTSDGCESYCVPSGAPVGTEICDGIDNNCNGTTDETFNLAADPQNCGVCGRICVFPNASAKCTSGTCQLDTCNANFWNVDGLSGNGCEYACTKSNGGVEICDGLDNDCDTQVDESDALVGTNCYPAATTGCNVATSSCQGVCGFGTYACIGGALVCQNPKTPKIELCDQIDNNCDGITDDGFDKLNDPRFCGPSCLKCSLPHAVPSCVGGVCKVAVCQAGYVNRNGIDSDGCEYPCTINGPEVCDGVDNDCDGATDAADPDLVIPANFCVQVGACSGTQPTCAAAAACGDSTVKWRCVYGGQVEVDTCGNRKPTEARCDNLDGNCDGNTDESFIKKGKACNDSGIGVCQGSGTYICDLSTRDDVICNVTTPGQSPGIESCNGRDDDCDGFTDEGTYGEMVPIAGGIWIMKYEASRPDATAGAMGSLTTRACSKGGVQPWRSIDWNDAAAACAASGLVLCDEGWWQNACEGAGLSAYPYGNGYQPNTCNGNDYDPDCSGPDQDGVLATGTPMGCPTKPALSACMSSYGAFDLSGNLKEWTATAVPMSSPTAYRIRGGAYDNIAAGLRCDFDFTSETPGFYFENLGFRCCSVGMPP